MTDSEPDVVAFDLWATRPRDLRRRQVRPARQRRPRRGRGRRGRRRRDGARRRNRGDRRLADASSPPGRRRASSASCAPCRRRWTIGAPATAAVARAAGLRRHEQLCEVRGTLTAGGTAHRSCAAPARAPWGAVRPAAGRRRRFVSAASADGRRRDRDRRSRPTGDHATRRGAGAPATCRRLRSRRPSAVEEVRLSTVYGADGLPREGRRRAARPGDEMPAPAVGGGDLRIGATSSATLRVSVLPLDDRGRSPARAGTSCSAARETPRPTASGR